MTTYLCVLALAQIPVTIRPSMAIPTGQSQFSFQLKRGGPGTGTVLTVPMRMPRGVLRLTLTGHGLDGQGMRVAMPPVTVSLSEPTARPRQQLEVSESGKALLFELGATEGSGTFGDVFRPDGPARWDSTKLVIFLPSKATADFTGSVKLEGPLPYRSLFHQLLRAGSASGEATLLKGKTYAAYFTAIGVIQSPSGFASYPFLDLSMKINPKGALAASTMSISKPTTLRIMASLAVAAGSRAKISVTAAAKSKPGASTTGHLQIREYEDALGVTWQNPTLIPK